MTQVLRKVNGNALKNYVRRVVINELNKIVMEETNLAKSELNIDNALKNNPNNTLEYKISELLKILGISSNILGYKYIREALLICYYDQKCAEKIMKMLYPKIANKYNTTVTRVERAMRHAIETSVSRTDPRFLNTFFKRDLKYAKVTNKEYINFLIDYIKLKERA